MNDEYLPAEVPYCCSGFQRPMEGHDVNPPCATTQAREKYRRWLREVKAEALEAAAEEQSPGGLTIGHHGQVAAWLRARAAEIREGRT